MKVLVVGYGSIGKRHVNILSEIDEISEIQIVTKQNIKEYKTYLDLKDINNLNLFDYFIISSITSDHEDQLIYLNERVKEKIILVEKPLSLRVFNLTLNNQIYVAYNLRFHPLIKKIKRISENEHILSVNIQTGQYLPSWRPDRDYSETYSAFKERGGGVLLDLSHELDYLIWVFGNIKSYSSINKTISNLYINSDDYFSSIGILQSGIVFNITIDYLNKIFMRNIIINTDSNTYFADLLSNRLVCADKGCQKEIVYEEPYDINVSYKNMHLQALSGNQKKELATFADGIDVLSWIEDIRNRNE